MFNPTTPVSGKDQEMNKKLKKEAKEYLDFVSAKLPLPPVEAPALQMSVMQYWALRPVYKG